ncbi:MAG: mobile mystery protein B [bacterium]|nr:mobile mystery protein B [bacterium]
MNIFETDDNSTPLTEEEKQQLKAKWVTTRSELNELETKGIADAEIWLLKNKKDILSETFIKALHKKMFGDIWKWAGNFRTTERNIGVAPYEIQPKLRILLDDIRFWIANRTYSEKEIAIRFHHRLVQIHPFPNGNGRISRIMADLIMRNFGLNDLDWGSGNLTEISELRTKYISSLQEADNGDYTKLINFIK